MNLGIFKKHYGKSDSFCVSLHNFEGGKTRRHLVTSDRFQDGKLWTSLKVTMERWEGQISKQYGTPMVQPMAQQIVQPMVQSMAHPIAQ